MTQGSGRRWLGLFAVAVLVFGAGLAAACGDDDDDGDDGITPVATTPAGDATEPAAEPTEAEAEDTPAAEATEPAAEGELTVMVAEDATLGEILVDSRGFTLYTFTNDTANSGESACVDACVNAWPPLTIDGEGVYDEAIAAGFGTITRPEGTTQVTYNGMPLYFFASDSAPGDTTGHEVGGVWFVATP